MILGPLILFIISCGMALWPAANIPENGLGLQQQPAAYSMSGVRRLVPSYCTLKLTFVRVSRALTNSTEHSLRVYSTGDSSDVYEDSFMAVAMPDGETFHPTLILVGTRLGIDKINQVYWEALTSTLQMPQSVGIAG